jgi:hypothetical protein
MFIIEDYPLENPHYHTAQDTLDTLNLTFHTDVTRSLAAAIASISGVSSFPDADNDTVADDLDNCPNHPNGAIRGTCTEAAGGVIIGTGVTCANATDCAGDGFCDRNQGDCTSNSTGDACECYADSNCDTKINLSDLVLMKQEFLQSPFYADCNRDNQVNLADLVIMKAQFLRTDCPACP